MRRVEARRGDIEQRQRGEAEQREAGAAQHEDHDHRDHRQRARDRQRDEQHHLLDLLDVGVRARHELTGLRLVVEREMQLLQMRDEPHAQFGLHAEREPERGVAAHCAVLPDLHEADHDDGHGVANAGGLVPGDDPVVDCVRGEQRDHDARSGEHQGRADARDEPGRMGDEQPAQEPPATPA